MAAAESKTSAKPVTQEALRKAWADFAESRRNQVAEYTILQRNIDIDGLAIKMTLTNPVEEPLIHSMRTELLAWLREALGNPGITLETTLQVAVATRAAYTNREKLDEIRMRYPLIGELCDRLGLDPDF